MYELQYNTLESGYEPAYGSMYDEQCIIIEDDEELLEDVDFEEGEVIYDRDHEQIIEGDIPFIDLPAMDDTVH